MSALGHRCPLFYLADLGGLKDKQIGFVISPKELRKQADTGFSFQYRLDLGEDGLTLLESLSAPFSTHTYFVLTSSSPSGNSLLMASRKSCEPPSTKSKANWYASNFSFGTRDTRSGTVVADELRATRSLVRAWMCGERFSGGGKRG